MHALHTWQAPPDLTERAELIVAELAANAALHGHVEGRNFRLSLAYDQPAATGPHLRIAVTDARGDALPPSWPATPDAADEAGRGLLLVAALSDRWGVTPYPPAGKTVWSECDHLHEAGGASETSSLASPPAPPEPQS